MAWPTVCRRAGWCLGAYTVPHYSGVGRASLHRQAGKANSALRGTLTTPCERGLGRGMLFAELGVASHHFATGLFQCCGQRQVHALCHRYRYRFVPLVPGSAADTRLCHGHQHCHGHTALSGTPDSAADTGSATDTGSAADTDSVANIDTAADTRLCCGHLPRNPALPRTPAADNRLCRGQTLLRTPAMPTDRL